MTPILKVENLKVKLNGETVIKNLNFEVEEKEVLVILGPNGAGKTVLLRTLLGLLPFQGRIQWQEGIKLGYVPQRLPFIRDFPMSVKEFFGLKKVSEKETSRLLDSVGMEAASVLEKKIGDFSSGQFQRILIAWGLAGDPQVLLFDEPIAGIDIGGEETIYNLLDRVRKEKNLTVLLVTHDLNIVYKWADNVLCLNKKTLCYGLPKEVLTPEHLSQLYGGELKFYKHTHKQ